MKVEEAVVTKVTITEVPRLDTITVFLEDLGPRCGKATITCWDKSWVASWGGMGDHDIRGFLLSCNNDYLANNFNRGISDHIYDLEELVKHAKRWIIKEFKKRWIDKEQARELFEMAENLEGVERVETLHDVHGKAMVEIFGEEWWYRLPTIENPEYAYLCRILDAVRSALTMDREAKAYDAALDAGA